MLLTQRFLYCQLAYMRGFEVRDDHAPHLVTPIMESILSTEGELWKGWHLFIGFGENSRFHGVPLPINTNYDEVASRNEQISF